MNSTNFRYFLAVAEEMNITKAAQKLYITQQSLSQQISRIEQEYHVTLFERTPRLRLTYAGEQMLKYAQRALNLEKEIQNAMGDLSEQKRGTISFGVRRSHSYIFLPPILHEFREQFPLARALLTEDTSAKIAQKLLSGDLDIGIVSYRFAKNPNLETISLLKDCYNIIIPENLLEKYFGLTEEAVWEGAVPCFDRIENIPILLTSTMGPMRNAVDDFLITNNVIEPNILLEGGNLNTALLLCSQGIGITFTYGSLWYSYPEIYNFNRYSLYSFPIGTLHSDPSSFLCYKRGRKFGTIAQAIIDISVEVAKKLEKNSKRQISRRIASNRQV